MLVYLAHPVVSDPTGNYQKAKRIAREIVNRYPEVVPVSPVLNFCYFREPEEREKIMKCCLQLLSKCEELWLTGNWWNSNGCLQEKQFAEELGIPVRMYSFPSVITAAE
jgi:hypothetical protein